MTPERNFAATFARLKTILQWHAPRLKVTADGPEGYSLDAPLIGKLGKPIYFGGVQIKKNYVSYHLMAVYIYPELLGSLSPALKKHMQGKSCFNFKTVDEALFAELAALTRHCIEKYQQENLVE